MNLFPVRDDIADSNGEIIWLYGLSGAGKSTLARLAASELRNKGKTVYILDGDNLRYGLNSDLSFSKEDRNENIRRAGEVAKIIAGLCDVVISTFITPSSSSRDKLDELMVDCNYKSVFINTPTEICEKRDIKGLYRKARLGEVTDFTGVSSPFDEPDSNSFQVDCYNLNERQSLAYLLSYIDSYSL